MDGKTSKMQKILDKVKNAVDADDNAGAILHLIEAIKLLSKAQQQVFNQVEGVRNQNPFVGGCD